LINYLAFHALSTFSKQRRADGKSRQHQIIPSRNFWECRESNPGRLGEKRDRYFCATPTPPHSEAI